MNTKVPEPSTAMVQLVEELRNSPDRTRQALASMMDTRLEYHSYEALKAARIDGFNRAEALSAFLQLTGGSVFAWIKNEPSEAARTTLTVLAILELQSMMERLAKEMK